MKITKTQLRQIIKEELSRALNEDCGKEHIDEDDTCEGCEEDLDEGELNEEAYDCDQDYKAGGLTWDEYQNCLKRFGEETNDPGSFEDTRNRDRWSSRGSSRGRWRRRRY